MWEEYEGDEWTEDDESFYGEGEDEDVLIDFEEISKLAKNKLRFHFACTLGADPKNLCDLFFAEAELLLNAADYKSALVAAVAADLFVSNTESTIRRLAIESICVYQMGARSRALEIAQKIEKSLVVSNTIVSSYLRNRFLNTLEVLRFMPELLGMLAGATKKNYNHRSL